VEAVRIPALGVEREHLCDGTGSDLDVHAFEHAGVRAARHVGLAQPLQGVTQIVKLLLKE
jgi:hypothetical protein